MGSDITSEDFAAPSHVLEEQQAALQAAHAQALAELRQIQSQASVEDTAGAATANYSMHDVAGVGRYVIPRRTGWKALLDIIHDPVPNIDFSANVYPAFDGVIGEHFQSPHLLDPLDDQYEARKFLSLHPGHKPYEDLRDNIAAVRNFLMQQYYTCTPEGMSPEKAKQSLGEIAAFVGDGLYNNWLFMGILPNHNPTKPFVSLSKAQEPNGKGAQYLYEKILEHQRHSDWMRPFTAVMALFGGKSSFDWQLPPASETHFTDWVSKDLASKPAAPDPAAFIAQAEGSVLAIEAQMAALRDAKALSQTAGDLDAIGSHLVYTATNMEGVAHISDPVRRDAVEIAKDILRKLKVSLGGAQVVDGLNMKPTDDVAALGAIKGVAMVYERLVAWARNNNDAEIFQHPAVMAATQAIGQLGYQAKREALRMATMAGDYEQIKSISEQMKRLPESFVMPSQGSRFGDLFAAVESGIDTIINRIQQVSVTGAKVGFSVDSNLGASLSAAPTAGISNQVGADDAAKRNAQAMMAEQMAAQAQAQRINTQLAAQARAQQAMQPQGQGQSQSQQPAQQQPAQQRSAGVGRQALQTARAQQRQATSSTTSTVRPPTMPMNAAQQQAAQRQATAASLAAAHEREEQLHRAQFQQAQQQAAALDKQKAAAKAAATKIDPSLLKGVQSSMNMQGITGAPIMGGRRIDPKSVAASMNKPAAPTTIKSAQTEAEKQQQNLYGVQPPRGTGRGF